MSAFIVDKAHINALVHAALRGHGADRGLRWYDLDTDQLWSDCGSADEYFRLVQVHTHEATHETANQVGRMLWLENLASVAARYPHDASGERPGPYDLTDEAISAYTYDRSTPYYEPVQVLKALACYEYQSCEHPGWKRSEARRFCEALRHKMINALPGYDAADWEILPREARMR